MSTHRLNIPVRRNFLIHFPIENGRRFSPPPKVLIFNFDSQSSLGFGVVDHFNGDCFRQATHGLVCMLLPVLLTLFYWTAPWGAGFAAPRGFVRPCRSDGRGGGAVFCVRGEPGRQVEWYSCTKYEINTINSCATIQNLKKTNALAPRGIAFSAGI